MALRIPPKPEKWGADGMLVVLQSLWGDRGGNTKMGVFIGEINIAVNHSRANPRKVEDAVTVDGFLEEERVGEEDEDVQTEDEKDPTVTLHGVIRLYYAFSLVKL